MRAEGGAEGAESRADLRVGGMAVGDKSVRGRWPWRATAERGDGEATGEEDGRGERYGAMFPPLARAQKPGHHCASAAEVTPFRRSGPFLGVSHEIINANSFPAKLPKGEHALMGP